MNDFTQSAVGTGQDIGSTTQDNFLRSTYNHLLGAVVAFIALEYILFASGIAAAIAPIMTSNWLMVIGGFMVLGWVTNYFTSKQASIGGQYFQMAVTVALQAVIFIPLLAYAVYYTDSSVLSNAVLVTLIVFAALTGIVGYTKANFSFLGPFLGIVGIVALLAIVGSVLFSVTLGFYFSLAMVVFAAGTVLYQTSKIKYDYGPGQHVAAGTALFASVALLFYYVLMSFVSRD
ncbi:MAG: FtsH-binding integral membrane protein [Candidatus Azotimanducaceae bacterium]|jgi:FtsH-binding integral membrane protein